MARLWEALKPAVGASAPWSAIQPAPPLGTIVSAEPLAGTPVEVVSPFPKEGDSAPPEGILDGSQLVEELLEPGPQAEWDAQVPARADGLGQKSEGSPLWEESSENSAFLEVGPSDDIRASQGVEIPQFSWKPTLLSPEIALMGKEKEKGAGPSVKPTEPSPPSEFPRIARHRPLPLHPSDADPVKGPIGPEVIKGILERLLQRTALDVHPWIYVSPPPRDGGLSQDKARFVVQGILEGLLGQCGEMCVLELDGPADGSSPTMGPGWQEVLRGRVEWEAALREGAKPGLWRFPSGSVETGQGPWFAARSVQGIALELRKRFPLVVVSSPLGTHLPIGKLWTAQCQGWAWVVSTRSWETTGLEETARTYESGMPPWIGCVLVDG